MGYIDEVMLDAPVALWRLDEAAFPVVDAVDGVLDGATWACASTADGGYRFLAGVAGDATAPANARIGMCAWYKHGLTAAQVLAHYNAGRILGVGVVG